MENSFIAKTAKDYDMEYHEVERIYKMFSADGLFYEKLEEFITIRKNS
jgi:hypothetical protein